MKPTIHNIPKKKTVKVYGPSDNVPDAFYGAMLFSDGSMSMSKGMKGPSPPPPFECDYSDEKDEDSSSSDEDFYSQIHENFMKGTLGDEDMEKLKLFFEQKASKVKQKRKHEYEVTPEVLQSHKEKLENL